MKKFIIFIILIIGIFLITYNAAYADSDYTVNDLTYIYSEKNGEMIGTLKKGYLIPQNNIIKKENDWLKIKINPDKLYLEAWIEMTNLKEQINNSNSTTKVNSQSSTTEFEFSDIKYKKQPGVGLITFIGNAHNTSNQTFNTVTFIFTVFDINNKKIDSTTVKLNNIKPDETKYISGHLYASLNEVDHYKVKIKEKNIEY